jgi:tetratricopeptide (TPR) repeat protein
LGNVYLKLDKNQEAISSYRKTVELDPNHLNAWINLAIASYNNGERLQAKQYYYEAVLLGFEPTADILQTFEAIH